MSMSRSTLSSEVVECSRPTGHWLCGVLNTGVWVQQADGRPAQPLTVYWIAEGRLLDFGLVHGQELSEGLAASYYAAVARGRERGFAPPERISVSQMEAYAAITSVVPRGVTVRCPPSLDLSFWEDEVRRACAETWERVPEHTEPAPADELAVTVGRIWRSAPWEHLSSSVVCTVSAPAWGLPFGGAILQRGRGRQEDLRALVVFRDRWAAEEFAAGTRNPGNQWLLFGCRKTPDRFTVLRNQYGALLEPRSLDLALLQVVAHAFAHFTEDRRSLVAGDALLANRFSLSAGYRSGSVDLYIEDPAELGVQLTLGRPEHLRVAAG